MNTVPPREPDAWPTPEQFLAEFENLTREQRLQRAADLIASSVIASDCVGQWHQQRLGKGPLTRYTQQVHVMCPDCGLLV